MFARRCAQYIMMMIVSGLYGAEHQDRSPKATPPMAIPARAARLCPLSGFTLDPLRAPVYAQDESDEDESGVSAQKKAEEEKQRLWEELLRPLGKK